jgi:hypothetical protein
MERVFAQQLRELDRYMRSDGARSLQPRMAHGEGFTSSQTYVLPRT